MKERILQRFKDIKTCVSESEVKGFGRIILRKREEKWM
jgi:hypothetical protein